MNYLNSVLRFYFVSSFFIFIFFFNDISPRTSFIYSYHFITIVLMFILYFYNYNYNKNYGKAHLLMTVGIISCLFIIVNNIISYSFRGNWFVFNEADALQYHDLATLVLKTNYNIDEILKIGRATNLDFADYGMIYYTYFVYLFVESNLMVNFTFWVFNLFSAGFMFNIALNFIPKKYAYLCSMFFFTSSYISWFNSSGLKEPIMIFLILSSYSSFYKFLKTNLYNYLIWSILPILILFFFRPIVFLFILFGYLSYFFMVSNVKKIFKTIIGVVGFVAIISSSFAISEYERYTGGSTSQMVETLTTDEGMLKGGGLFFNYIVNILAALLGPFPTVYTDANFGVFKTITIDNRLVLSFYYPGLFLKILLSTAFFTGFYYSLKTKNILLIPIVLFFTLEIIGLVFTLEVLEVRKNIPHFMWFYLFIFYGVYLIDEKKIFNRYKSIFSTVNNLLLLFFLLIVIFWNLR
jgi:hypothetical protein